MTEEKHAKTEKGVAGTMPRPFGRFAPTTKRAYLADIVCEKIFREE